MSDNVTTILAWLDKVPWQLVLVVIVIPLLHQWTAKVKNEKLRAIYEAVVEAIEQTYGTSTGAEKKAVAVETLTAKGIKNVDNTLLESVVFAKTTAPCATVK
jgi:hypothetical protein